MIEVNFYADNTQIKNSYLITTRKIVKQEVIRIMTERKAKGYLITRSIGSYVREWRGHNRLYKLGLFKSHTQDVDLEEPSKWYLEIIWFILGVL